MRTSNTPAPISWGAVGLDCEGAVGQRAQAAAILDPARARAPVVVEPFIEKGHQFPRAVRAQRFHRHPLHRVLGQPSPDPDDPALLFGGRVVPRRRCQVMLLHLDLHAGTAVDDRGPAGVQRDRLGQHPGRLAAAGRIVRAVGHAVAYLRHDEPPGHLPEIDAEGGLPARLDAYLGPARGKGSLGGAHGSSPFSGGDAEHPADPVAPVGQAALDGAVGTAVTGGDLGDAQTVQVEGPQGGALAVGDLLHGLDDGRGCFPLPGLGHAQPVDHGRQGLRLQEQLAALGGAEVVAAAVAGHLQHPGPHIARVSRRRPLQIVNQGLLQDILHLVAGADPRADQPRKGAFVTPDQPYEGVLAAPPDPLCQQVVAWTGHGPLPSSNYNGGRQPEKVHPAPRGPTTGAAGAAPAGVSPRYLPPVEDSRERYRQPVGPDPGAEVRVRPAGVHRSGGPLRRGGGGRVPRRHRRAAGDPRRLRDLHPARGRQLLPGRGDVRSGAPVLEGGAPRRPAPQPGDRRHRAGRPRPVRHREVRSHRARSGHEVHPPGARRRSGLHLGDLLYREGGTCPWGRAPQRRLPGGPRHLLRLRSHAGAVRLQEHQERGDPFRHDPRGERPFRPRSRGATRRTSPVPST